MTSIYTGCFSRRWWIFPLFPAAPKLGPVYQNVTSMVPLWFPVLLIVPAFAIDPCAAADGRALGRLAIGDQAGVVFMLRIHLAQWPFADF